MRETRPLLLLLDDDPQDRVLARVVLERELPRLRIEEIADAPSFAQACGRRGFNVVVLESRLQWADGLAILLVLREDWPEVPVILFTRYGSEEMVVRAMRLGASDYLVKSPAGFLRLAVAVRSALEKGRAEATAGAAPLELHSLSQDPQQFASIAAHELQEPVRMMERHAMLLKHDFGGKLGAAGDELVDAVADSARRLRTMIDDLLAFSRLDSRELRREHARADELLDRALANLGAAVEESGATIGRSPLPEVEADPFLVTQVFQNLLANAFKFRGPEPPRIQVAARRSGREWVFSVRDNGLGLDPADAESIFAMFTRLHPEIPGSGIGLALCRKIVERHGGRIWVESQPGRGATFSFTLPATIDSGA